MIQMHSVSITKAASDVLAGMASLHAEAVVMILTNAAPEFMTVMNMLSVSTLLHSISVNVDQAGKLLAMEKDRRDVSTWTNVLKNCIDAPAMCN